MNVFVKFFIFYKYQLVLSFISTNYLFLILCNSKTMLLYIFGGRFKNTRLSIFNDKTSLVINEWKVKETFFPTNEN